MAPWDYVRMKELSGFLAGAGGFLGGLALLINAISKLTLPRVSPALISAFVAAAIAGGLVFLVSHHGHDSRKSALDIGLFAAVGLFALIGATGGGARGWSARKSGWQTWSNPVVSVAVSALAWASALIITAPLW